jgi:hypothetical protein
MTNLTFVFKISPASLNTPPILLFDENLNDEMAIFNDKIILYNEKVKDV